MFKDVIENIEKTVDEINLKIRLQIEGTKQPASTVIGLNRDINHDPEVFPYPLTDESCELILIHNTIGHIKPENQVDLINECWRMLAKNGILLINAPYGINYRYVADPKNISPWNEFTPLYFCPKDLEGNPSILYEEYKPKPYQLLKCDFDIWGVRIGMKKI